MSLVDSYCEGCAYLGKLSGIPYCAFCDATGHMRGCSAGTGCTRRAHGERAYSPNHFSFERQNERKPERKAKLELSDAELSIKESLRKKEAAARNRAMLQGRQREAILNYRNSHGLDTRTLAEMVGVKTSTLEKWISEYNKADWDKLAAIGLPKPEGMP